MPGLKENVRFRLILSVGVDWRQLVVLGHVQALPLIWSEEKQHHQVVLKKA